ncbi:serine/arginine repetitive matrix protein 1-like [Telopea speciosissima]|uniref:serine/arginine repetitive matrix protein 1-like n=1 Tax=Telopea speciosissima TaxID=54955 RepID=UPI001CC34B5D|nr:serine/arginine repetitive matrix protein 1-like [Telopea speciosissima]
MGCCISTNKSPGKQAETSKVKEAAGNGESHPPPPPPFEEETVKEVLSETPTPKPSFRNVEALKNHKPSFPKIEKEKPSPPPTPPLPLPPSFTKKGEERANDMESRTTPPPDPSPAVDEISEVSDMCSLSETVSTTTIGERYPVDDGEVRQRVDRSPAKIPRKRPVNGDLPGKTEWGGRSPPARRLNQSPGRRNDSNVMKPSQIHHQSTKDMGGGGGGYTRRQRIPGSGGSVKRDPGESSGRRSRSPATRPVLGRSPSSRAVRSPGRITALDQDNERRPEEAREEGNWPTNESLENPLVSMECFIFL